MGGPGRRIDYRRQAAIGHGGAFSKPIGGAVAHVAVDWLEWQLKGDKTAARTFVGENCRLCSGTDWTIKKKGF